MKSMTGFGTGDAPLGHGKLVLDARSVNHRYLDVRVRLPGDLADQSLFLEQRARERLGRGRFDLSVRYEGPPPAPRFDADRARALYRELERLRDELAPGTELPLSALVGMPDLYVPATTADVAIVQQALGAALDAALGALERMRKREGEALRAEVLSRLGTCRRLHGKLREGGPSALRAAEARLKTRVARLAADVGTAVESGRLEAEIVLLADRTDVTEELVRLESHFSQLEGLLERGEQEPCGRRLDFLLQEVAREANTIGAKSQDAELGHLVVELKSEIERMREQVQNVE
ncbi:MAG TPA: YicC/YloC family endoribonuclease [Polyangiaceae bacterium]|nr:YicC/YloC family endoribonuclease [Polyangiaceae bacterium]